MGVDFLSRMFYTIELVLFGYFEDKVLLLNRNRKFILVGYLYLFPEPYRDRSAELKLEQQ